MAKFSFLLSMVLASVVGTWLMSSEVNNNEVRAIQLISQLEFVAKANGEIYKRNDTVSIYFIENIVVYREQFMYIKYNRNAIRGDTVVMSNDQKSVDFRELRYDHYIWRGNDKTGIKYSGNGDKIKVINVDSLKIKKLFKNAQLYNIKYDRLMATTLLNDHSVLEKYVNVYKPDESYCDTTYFVFSKHLRCIPYSLSPKADSIKNAKLIEVRYIYNPIANGIANKINIPKREMIFKIVELKTSNTDGFRAFVKKYNTDSKLLDLK